MQESYDNAGLIVGNESTKVSGVIISLDCTEAIVDEAIDKKCNLVIAHHPIVFKGLKRFNGSNYRERTIIKAIKNDIAIFAIHTNLDNVRYKGVNTKIANRLGLINCQILDPKDDEGLVGAGMLGALPKPIGFDGLLKLVKEKMDLRTFKYTRAVKPEVQSIAVCGGSGSFLLHKAIAAKADVFITSDFKYHEFFDANDQIVIIDIGHYQSERFTIDLLYDLISDKFSTFAAHCTKINTNPVKYF